MQITKIGEDLTVITKYNCSFLNRVRM